MLTQVKVVGWLYVAVGALYLFLALWLRQGHLANGGGAQLLVGAAPALALWMALGNLADLSPVLLLLGIASVTAGSGLVALRPWARVAGIALASLYILNLWPGSLGPGLLLGVYAFAVLVLPATDRLFRAAPER